jgi:GT2 family glycosyltransferase
VIPALGGQDKLDLVLAALAEQSYPERLLEVVVVDDGSEPPLTLPEHRPGRTRLLRTPEGQWGISRALNTGIEAAEGEIILRVDSDTLLSRVHVESQARWHHLSDYLMVLGTILYVTDPELADLNPGAVAEATAAGRLGQRFAPCRIEENWGAERIRVTDRLVQLDARAYSVANGPAVSFRKAFWKEVGGLREDLLLGEDTELGYRFAQYGAVIIPDRSATAWHLGATTAMTRPDDADRARMPAVANCIPLNRHLRKAVGRIWEVPLVEVVVDADGASHEAIRATVDSLLAVRTPPGTRPRHR